MVKRAPSGARVEALPLRPQAAPLPPSPPSPMGRPRRPAPRPATPAGKTPLLGLRQGPGPRRPAARELGDQAPHVPLPGRRGAHQLPREPRPRSRPLGPYHSRARGGGRAGGPLMSAALPPGPPAAAQRWSRLDCGTGGFPAATRAVGGGPRRPYSLVNVRSRENAFFWVRARWTFLPSLFLFIFSSCLCDLMAMVMLGHTEVKPLIFIYIKL